MRSGARLTAAEPAQWTGFGTGTLSTVSQSTVHRRRAGHLRKGPSTRVAAFFLSLCCLVPTISCGSRPVALAEAGAPGADGSPRVSCAVEWTCTAASGQPTVCRTLLDQGLPPGGSAWSCQSRWVDEGGGWDVGYLVWICTGQPTAGRPAGGCGWSCELTAENLVCQKREGPEDLPPGGLNLWTCRFIHHPSSCFACSKGSELGGGQCLEAER